MAIKLNVKKENFSEWWDKVVFYADLIDDRFPLKGTYVWKPYGFAALKLMVRIMENLLEETGHKEAYFPIFVPASVFAKEEEFLKGFGGEILKVTKVGHHVLDQELIVRPTSETIIYPMFALWIRSWRDLPIKVYQTVPVFRWETKMTKAMFRVREIVKFKEAHTAHASREDADAQIKEGLTIYSKFFDMLKIPYIIIRTPTWETFPGALYNYDFITVMPDGKVLELGSVINLGQKFAKVFDIKFRDKDGEIKYIWQTCYGISERSLGASLALHGDDAGLIFVSTIAPIQIIIVPILKGGKSDAKIIEKAKALKEYLQKEFRVEIDLSEKSPGEKFYHWEAKGVPIRIEIGENELKTEKYSIILRDSRRKESVAKKDLVAKIKDFLTEIDNNLYTKAKKAVQASIKSFTNIQSAALAFKKEKGIIKLPWCGSENCGRAMESEVSAGALGYDESEKPSENAKCAKCGQPAKWMLAFGKTY
ncbi:MAG: proline--tRNA ligase [Candidatus Nanoarchaeia archaeon]